MSAGRSLPLVIVVAAIFASPAFAQAGQAADERESAWMLSGGVTIASEYRLRGISLSDQELALQGTINFNHKNGLYAGLWGSNLDGYGELGGSVLELDFYGGWRGDVAKGLTLDVGLLYFAYPGSSGELGLFEPYAKLTGVIGRVTTTVGAAYAWAQDALEKEKNLYLFNDSSLPINGTPIMLTTHIGHSTGGSALAAGSNYWDWSLGAAATVRNLSFGIAYVDTDIGEGQALAIGATKAIVDSAIVATLSVSF